MTSTDVSYTVATSCNVIRLVQTRMALVLYLLICGCSGGDASVRGQQGPNPSDVEERERDGTADADGSKPDSDRQSDEYEHDDSPSVRSDAGSAGANVDAAVPTVGRDAAVDGEGTDASAELGGDAGARDGSTRHEDAANSSGSPSGSGEDCTSLPAGDYAEKGPFADAKMFEMTGPTGGYFMYRPDASLGRGGFKHPLAVWGNGILTTADQYKQLLTHIASHGFVVIACPDTRAERDCLDKGLTWLAEQNDREGPLKGKLDTSREVAIGYSWGGGAAIDTSNRTNIKATVSIQGMPPRLGDAFDALHAPLLLFTTTGDTFVSASGYVTPNYNLSGKVPTFYATLQEDVGHLYPLDSDAASAVAEPVLGGPLSGAVAHRAPTVAFLRHFACADDGARKYFYGPSCELCGGKWRSQNKPTEAWDG